MMVQAKQVQSWDHTAALMCIIANIVRGKDQQPLTPEQLNPYREQPKVYRKPFAHLKELLTHGNGRSN